VNGCLISYTGSGMIDTAPLHSSYPIFITLLGMECRAHQSARISCLYKETCEYVQAAI
jgi:hypothetical protein